MACQTVCDMAEDSARPRLLILYGSQTGTAQDMAEGLGRRAKRRGFEPVVEAWDSYEITRLPEERLAVVLVSTMGDGEEPDNMKASWRFLLRKALPVGSLSSLRFALLGLGDSSYPKFNAVARRLYTRLKQLGAQDFAPLGLADDQSAKGALSDFDEWCKVLWPALLALHPQLSTEGPISDQPVLEPPLFDCRVLPPGEAELPVDEADEDDTGFYQMPLGATHLGPRPFPARLVGNARATADGWAQETRYLDFDISGFPTRPGLERPYCAGDVALLYPENPDDAVTDFVTVTGLDPQATAHISRPQVPVGCKPAPPLDLPRCCTIRKLVKKYLDVTGTPRRVFFEQLSLFSANEEERDKLLELASPEGADLFHEYCTREKRSYIEVLADFPASRPPLPRLLELIPRIKPRAFSIASSCRALPDRLQLLVAVVRFRTFYKRQRQGLCSTYLSTLPPGSTVPLWIRPGSFVLPSDPSVPLVMVGPGTGVAPFRAMIQERRAASLLAAATTAHQPAPEAPQANGNGHHDGGEKPRPSAVDWLYFGCRHEAKDYYYRHEWEQWQSEGRLVHRTAFSRDVPEGQPRAYVTHRLAEDEDRLWDLLANRGASFFVAGSAKRMPTDVMAAVKKMARKQGGMDEAQAERFVMALVRGRRYCVESWS